MKIVEDEVHADDFVVEVVIALRRRKERVAERDKEIQNIDGLSGQREQIELADERRVVSVQEFQQVDQRRPQISPRTERQAQPTPLLVAQDTQHDTQRQFVQLVRKLLQQVTQDELDDHISNIQKIQKMIFNMRKK